MPSASLPSPPLSLLQRTGWLGQDATRRSYDEVSAGVKELMGAMLPGDWRWPGKRVLDFGCGAGRLMRQFAAEAEVAEFTGCDIHGASIDWLQQNLCPPFVAFQCSEEPVLPQPDGYFDLIYAISVYTHLTDNWAGWLLEHHRVLAEGGFLLVSFLGEGQIGPLIGEVWDEDRIGMNSLWAGKSWEKGGPIVFHSPWWLRAHWGRIFEIVELAPRFGGDVPTGHGMVLLRRKSVQMTVGELERLEPHEPRETTALAHHVEQLRRETLALRAENEELRATASWKVTRPMRALKRSVARGDRNRDRG